MKPSEPKVVRYRNWDICEGGEPVEMVRYSDYETLAEKLGWTEEAVKVLQERVKDVVASRERHAERMKELEFGAHGVTADELRADNAKLREALERITKISAKDSGYLDYARWQMMLTVARQALEVSDEG